MRISSRFSLALAVVVTATAAAPASASAASGTYHVDFIDVGQGDSAWVHSGDGWDVLVDGGVAAKGPTVTAYLRDRGVTQIDAVVATHPDADHIGGLANVVTALPVGLLVSNGAAASTAAYRNLMSALAAAAVPTQVVRAGDQLSWGCCVHADVLHPASLTGSSNDDSLVIRVNHDACHVLLTGDVEANGEAAMLGGGALLQADVLKVAHHGSDTSSTQAFLEAVLPSIAVVSVGPNSYGHPSAEVLARLSALGAQVYRTDEVGSIEVVGDEAGCHVASPTVVAPTAAPAPSSTRLYLPLAEEEEAS